MIGSIAGRVQALKLLDSFDHHAAGGHGVGLGGGGVGMPGADVFVELEINDRVFTFLQRGGLGT